MNANPILAAMEVHVSMGLLSSHVCASQATLGCIVRKVSGYYHGFLPLLLSEYSDSVIQTFHFISVVTGSDHPSNLSKLSLNY